MKATRLTLIQGVYLWRNLVGNYLRQYGNKLTREKNILDLIPTTTKILVHEINASPVFSSRDHRIIPFNIKVK